MKFPLACLAACGLAFCGTTQAQETAPRFNRDIRRILSEKCFQCHGPDRATRQANLRLDRRDEALARQAFVPGQAQESELVRRISSSGDDHMPPRRSGRELTSREVDLLRAWIEAGAEYEPHWAFVPAQTPQPPAVGNAGWVRNPIDRFVLAELERRGLSPSPEADACILARRVALALTGLPATSTDVPVDYEPWVDQLFESPRYAERMTLDWLDAARYADTNGYFSDFPRQAWPWRDWVLRAFAANMRFDQFTIEQLAGDLLPDATIEQRVATAFHRNHMVTDETGVIDEEYRVSYVADRVETTGAVWLGLTLGCARCHDHKFDPLTQAEYYQLFAYFNQVPETGLMQGSDNPLPVLSLPTPEQSQQLTAVQAERSLLEAQAGQREPAWLESQEAWLPTLEIPNAATNDLAVYLDFENASLDRGPHLAAVNEVGSIAYAQGMLGHAATFDATNYAQFQGPALDTDQPFSLAVWFKPGNAPVGYIVSKIDNSAAQRGLEVFWYKSRPRLNLVRTWRREAIELSTRDTYVGGEWHHLVVSYDGSGKAAGFTVLVDGQEQPMSVRRDSLQGSVANDAPWHVAWKGSGLGFEGQIDELRLYSRALSSQEGAEIFWHDVLAGAIARPLAERTPEQMNLVRSYYLRHGAPAEAVALAMEFEQLRERERFIARQIASVSVMQELAEPRDTFILERGQYNQQGEKVSPNVPTFLGTLPADGAPSRLRLARWLVAPENPLTARVVVNRLWQQVFGEGLVRSVNDFGLRGDLPTHPELLDWLATEFVRSGWDVRHMLRLMVTSATFRQSSAASAELRELDPDNRLLARGARFRLHAELIRDQALAVSGLLVERLGGPSVKPYQPPGLWEAVSYNADQVYEQDHGESLYRRSLYTFWKRQAPPPDILTLDGPTRETCVVRRSRTNSPLQSLLLLNDVTYVEAARALASRVLRESGPSPAERARFAFRLTTGRDPDEAETVLLCDLYKRQLDEYGRRHADAVELLKAGELPLDASLDQAELAAWTLVASVLLNLDETITQH